MKRKMLALLLAIGLAALGGLVISGCGTAASKTLTGTVTGITTVGTSDATLSGTFSISGGTVDLAMNPILKSGTPVDITSGKVKIRIGTDLTTIASSGVVTFTMPTTTKPIDIVFVLDNTGSMGGAITGSKDSINAFAASLEAASIDARFGLVTFGDSAQHPSPTKEVITLTDGTTREWSDCSHERPVQDFTDSVTLKAKLVSTEADGGSDGPENPLDAIMYGYDHLTWRSTAQKVFIVITDINAHQKVTADTSVDNRCTTTATQTVTALLGKAVVYAVSPDFSYSQSPFADVRMLADGLGEARITAETNTGGKWIEFVSSGFDLNTLGISTAIAKSYSLRFEYSFSEGVYYVYIQVDTDGDGIYDSNVVFTITIGSASGGSPSVAFGNPEPRVLSVAPVSSGKVYVAPPNN